MVDIRSESMVGGTSFHRKVIHSEISSVFVLNLSRRTKRCSRTAQDNYALDNAFALIEGHPQISGQRDGWDE